MDYILLGFELAATILCSILVMIEAFEDNTRVLVILFGIFGVILGSLLFSIRLCEILIGILR